MSELERAKLIPVSGNNDTPDLENAIDVQFNPISLKVTLSNTLKANNSQGNSRAAQFVDKSSSTLAVELQFDTSYIESATASEQSGSRSEQIEQGSDVRELTKEIAEKFLKPVASGSQMQAPSRVLFQWGAFEFVGMVQTYDETLDFFSPKGRPLRARLALKLSEDRYQFRSNDSETQNAEQSPTLSFTGNGSDEEGGSDAGNGASAPNQNSSPVPGGSDNGPGNWRDNAMFNGIESPRLPTAAALALPSVGVSASVGGSAGMSASFGASAGVSVSASANATIGATAAAGGGPAFKFGNSSALGTGIPGAFCPQPGAGLNAASLQQGSLRLRSTSTGSGSQAPSLASESSVQVGAAVLNTRSDDGVGFE